MPCLDFWVLAGSSADFSLFSRTSPWLVGADGWHTLVLSGDRVRPASNLLPVPSLQASSPRWCPSLWWPCRGPCSEFYVECAMASTDGSLLQPHSPTPTPASLLGLLWRKPLTSSQPRCPAGVSHLSIHPPSCPNGYRLRRGRKVGEGSGDSPLPARLALSFCDLSTLGGTRVLPGLCRSCPRPGGRQPRCSRTQAPRTAVRDTVSTPMPLRPSSQCTCGSRRCPHLHFTARTCNLFIFLPFVL